MTATTYDDIGPAATSRGAAARHGHELDPGIAVLPELPALLRPDVPRGEGPRARAAVRARLQRLDGRRVVRVERRTARAAVSRPALGSDARRAEVERNAARGVRAVCFSEIPAYLGLPSIHSGEWDPFFAACEATGTVLCLHIGSGTKMPSTSRRRAARRHRDHRVRQLHADYPHSNSTWPDSPRGRREDHGRARCRGGAQARRGNVISLFGLDLPESP